MVYVAGKYIIYLARDLATRTDTLCALPASGGGKPIELLKSRFQLGWAHVSSDGGYFTYTSNESARYEVYVREFKPDAPSPPGRWQISTEGGRDGSWDPDGKELYYVDLGSTLHGGRCSGFRCIGEAKAEAVVSQTYSGRTWAAGNDNRRCRAHCPQQTEVSHSELIWGEDNSPIHVLVNWTAALRK